VYVVVSSSSSNRVVIEEKRRERESKEKKSYFIKNGIEPLLPSCHPSVYDLYKLTGQTQTLVLRRIIRLQSSSKRRTQTERYRQVRRIPSSAIASIYMYIYYLCTFPFFCACVCIRFFLSSMSEIIKQNGYVRVCGGHHLDSIKKRKGKKKKENIIHAFVVRASTEQ